MKSPAAYAQEALWSASVRAELALSVVRAVFCGLVAIRFVSLGLSAEDTAGVLLRGAVMLPPTIAAAVLSVVLVQRARRGGLSPHMLVASVLADAVVCTLAIGSNVLWPFPDYPGILLAPETMTFLALVFAAGFRASSRLAVIGAVANAVGLGILVVADLVLNPDVGGHGMNHISLFVVMLGCTAALSILGARRTERLVGEAAEYSRKMSRAEHGLSALMEEHHDALGLVSAALFGVERVRSSGSARDVLDLEQDLTELQRAVSGIREQALRELLVLRPPVPVSLADALRGHRGTLERLAAPLSVSWEIDEGDVSVLVAGGSLALQRVISNLLVNAREGDGVEGASRAVVAVETQGQWVTVSVSDDGPGFSSHAEGESTKPAGTGTGLRFARAVADASGGRLFVDSTPSGARICLVFRRREHAGPVSATAAE